MSKLIKVPMIFVRVGSVFLIFAAFLYLYLGYPYVTKGMFAANLDGAVSAEVKAVWLGFCLQLFFMAYLLFASSRRASPQKLVVLLCGLLVLVDAFLIRAFLANTMGAQLLMVSGLLILLGNYSWFILRNFQPKPTSIA
jgi:hypothetical protein